MNEFIPVNEPVIGEREKELVNECLRTGWISSEGPFVREFETTFSQRVERQHGIACANGSAALDIAIAALKIGPDDEVILPSFTIISCAAAIVRAGATPVVVDADPNTWNMDTGQIEAVISARTKAIMVVHIYGLPVDMEPVIELADRYSLAVIEDAAELIGGTYNGKPCGSFGTISTFSFYPNKHITTGEGGMVCTNDEDLAERCRSLRNLCFQPNKRFIHDELGWNYRLTNLQAAIGLGQLERLDQVLEKKRAIGKIYDKLIDADQLLSDALQLPIRSTRYATNLYWVYALVIRDHVSFDAETICSLLSKRGIGTRPFFFPIHQQPVFRELGLFVSSKLPICETIAQRGFYIPSGLSITPAQQDRVISELHTCVKELTTG